MYFAVMFVVFVALIIAGPLAVIWALNTLFPVLAIPYTVGTWLATVVLFTVIGRPLRVKLDNRSIKRLDTGS